MDQAELAEKVREHERILRGHNGDAGLIEQVRGLAWLPDAVKTLQRGDIMQNFLTEGLFRIGWAVVLVAITVIVTRALQ